MAVLTPVTHIIFDLDGLLLDSESIYKTSWVSILKKYGKSYTDEVRIKVLGTKEQDTCRILIEELQLPLTPEELAKEYMECISETLKDVELKAGAEKLIQHFHKNSVPMAVATSSGKESCRVKLEKFPELTSCFSHIVMGSSDIEVVNGKPAPDIFFVAAKRFPGNPSPDQCLVFEDSYYGVLAARAAGMQVVMVPEDWMADDKRKEASVVYDSLEDFVPEMFGLPSYDT